ncbi:Intraflagellar transport protein 81 [Thoreauomyces humboldtii]|nr:Intraflagellar transport protein 81 [Thoreauomyces humboldtii]
MSTTQPDLKLISSILAAPPFSRSYSAIQLHDEVPVLQLMQLISDAMAFIDEANPQSPHKKVDMRNEDPEESVLRVAVFLQLLKWKDAGDMDVLCQKLMEGDRSTILRVLQFLLKDLNLHKKRAYLAPFLAAVDVPAEFGHDEITADLMRQVEELQNQFKETHKTVDGSRGSGNNAALLKKEIQQLEDEKQQVQSKINKIRRRVEEIPQHESWLEAAKNLRLEQHNEAQIAERIKEQKHQTLQAENRYTAVLQELKDAKSAIASGGPEALYAKMEEDNKMNRYLALENLPKACTGHGLCRYYAQIEEAQQHIRQLKKVLGEPALSPKELTELEAKINSLNESIAKLAEDRLAKTTKGDDKLALFRQQAAIILRKKEGTTVRLTSANEEVAALQAELEKKKEASAAQGAKMPKGEEFKRYVAELRTKSTFYKQKKAELSAITAEFGILQRSEEILENRQHGMEESLTALEKRHGVSGFHVAQETLEKVSERKAEVDEAKGRTLEEISAIITKLTNNINEKKNHLSPVIQELRTLRQQLQELETEYGEKKRTYDATMAGLESEALQIEQEVKAYRQDIHNDQSRYHYLNMQIGLADVAHDRVMQEMKSYIGGDEALEQQQKARGFKTYRELYNKRIAEQEILGKGLREMQKDAKVKHEPNVKQLALFHDVRKLLALKAAQNKKILTGENRKDQPVRQDRLVL